MALRLWPEINSHLLRFEMHVALVLALAQTVTVAAKRNDIRRLMYFESCNMLR